MPSLFQRFKRKSNSHKSAQSLPSPPSPVTAQAPSSTDRANTTIQHRSQGSLDLDTIPPRTTSLRASGTADARSETTDPPLDLQKLAITDAEDIPQLPPLSFENDSDTATRTLQAQRNTLVDEIASEARSRKGDGLNDAGKAAFHAAGMGEHAEAAGTLEVETRYLKPVIQETIIVKEHTETTVVVDQHIHRHHVYPKIQPISDPNPIRLEPRHRIFSAADGKWHEVIGDAAAIAILGEDAFYNGKKEVREERKMALPGLGGEVNERAFEARVVEREGVKGEGMGSWHQLKGLAGLEADTPSEMKGEGWLLPEDGMGPVARTVGIAL